MARMYNPRATLGLDIGASTGELTDLFSKKLSIEFVGIEPIASEVKSQQSKAQILYGWANDMPFNDESFDIVTFCSVYEHIQPEERLATLKEIARVLKTDGLLLCQIPNMYFPIEFHSLLPLQQFLPRAIGDPYARILALTPWPHKLGMDWFRIGPRHIVKDAQESGLEPLQVSALKYFRSEVPKYVRPFTALLSVLPVGFKLCFRKKRHKDLISSR